LTSFYNYIGYSTISIEDLEKNMSQNSKKKNYFFKNLGIITIILMVFGGLILLFSLFYFNRYAKKHFNIMVQENRKKNLDFINDDNSLNEIGELSINP
jgi:uncharacterized membrane protein YukC